MSAIYGMVHFDNDTHDLENFNSCFIAEYQEKCKVDSYQYQKCGSALFGCAIQHITNESVNESLPIVDHERSLIFTADCILDNRNELIDILSAFDIPKSALCNLPDGALMYHAYLNLGNDCVNHFRGLYAIAIWDDKAKCLTLISDQVSARCLYYIKFKDCIIFSTLLSPITRYLPDLKLNKNYFKDFLMADASLIYVVPGETPYRDVQLILPATCMTFTDQNQHSRIYWSPDYNMEKTRKSPEDYATEFMDIYRACVSDAIYTSGETGIAMSSGLDSSSIGVLAADKLVAKGKKLKTYTFVPYEKQQNFQLNRLVYDESSIVTEIADHSKNMETCFLNNHGKNVFEDMNLCSSILEMPYKSGSFPSFYEMCERASSDGCRIFLNGCFGNHSVSFGYLDQVLYDLYLNKKYITMLRYINHFGKHEKCSRANMLKNCLSSFKSFKNHKGNLLDNFVPENIFLSRNILKNYDFKERFSADKHFLSRTGYIDQTHYPDYLIATSLFMYLGIFETKFGLSTNMVLRDPTKDIRLLSFCLRLPYHLFAYNGETRWLIRHNFRELLPQSVLGIWQQHGLQNIDWTNRIERDWDSLKPLLLQHLEQLETDEYIVKERVKDYLESLDFASIQERNKLIHLCTIDCMIQYIMHENKI